MRPNVEEIRERLQQIEDRKIDSRTEWCVHLALQKLPEVLVYINELENMPLLQTIAEQKQEIERLREALNEIADGRMKDWQTWKARQALGGEAHGNL